MKSAAWEIQQAVYTALTGSSTYITRWYAGDVPHNTALPYGTVAEFSVLDDSAQGIEGAEHSVTLNFYASTVQTVMQAMADTIDILELQTLTLSSSRHVAWCCRHDGFETTLREQDIDSNFSYSRGIQRWRIRTHYIAT